MELVEELKKSNIKGLTEWGKVIQVFCQKYQRIFGVKIKGYNLFPHQTFIAPMSKEAKK